VAGGALIAVAVAACSLLPAPGGMGLSSSSCANLPSGACTEQLDLVAARHPGATDVALRCDLPLCDRQHGAGTAVVTLADGTRTQDVFSYTRNPAPVPAPGCTGLAIDICRRVAASSLDDVPPSHAVAEIEITCRVARCTADAGEVTVSVTLDDGSVSQWGMAWEGGPP
jgi:hypothetical protein